MQECPRLPGAWRASVVEGTSRSLRRSSCTTTRSWPRRARATSSTPPRSTRSSTLRTRMMTDTEKREACATDPRLAALIARSDSLPDEVFERLHGTLRDVRFEGDAAPAVPGFAPGDHVLLRPGARRTDAQDMFLAGMAATVRSVMRDVDGRVCLAVTVDGDPGGGAARRQGSLPLLLRRRGRAARWSRHICVIRK